MKKQSSIGSKGSAVTDSRFAPRLNLGETPEQRWEKAGIGSDVIFCRVMQNKDLFLKLMQRIFPELRLVAIKDHTIQKTGYGPIDSKGVRFDVYSEIDGRCFDVEMQMRQEGDERKRTRYYQCMMDEQLLQTGMSYSELPESYVVMIGTFDLFGQNRHIYRFRNYEMSDKSLLLDDGTMKVFLNSRGTEDDISDELKNFLDLVNGLEPADDFCEELYCEVRKAKQSAEVRRSYMDLEDKLRHERNRALKEGIEYGREQGLEQGLKEGHEQGLEQGLKEGREQGIKQGIETGRRETLINLVQSGSITLQAAAVAAGMSETAFQEEMAEQSDRMV